MPTPTTEDTAQAQPSDVPHNIPAPQQAPRSNFLLAIIVSAIVMTLLLFLNIHAFGRIHKLEQELADARKQLLTYEMRVESGLAEQRNLKTSLELSQQEKKEFKSDLASYRRQIDEILPSALDIGKKLDGCYTERDAERTAKDALTTENESLREQLKNCNEVKAEAPPAQDNNKDTPPKLEKGAQ